MTADETADKTADETAEDKPKKDGLPVTAPIPKTDAAGNTPKSRRMG